MPQAVYILFGALFTVATATALGTILLKRCTVKLERGEYFLFGFLGGSAILSTIVFLLAAVHVVRKGVFLAVGILVIAWAIRYRKIPARVEHQRTVADKIFIALYILFGIVYFLQAMAPELSPDGITYHLGLVSRYYQWHGFRQIATSMYANLSQGMEMLFLFAYAFGRHSAAALVHFAFLMALPLLMVRYARRFELGHAGVFGGLLVFLSPIVGVDGSSAYNDVAVACVLFGLFYLLQLTNPDRTLLVAAGLLAGFSYALKYTAGLAIPYALAKTGRRAPIVLACASIVVAPWLIKNTVYARNPLAPFANAWFPNPYMKMDFEQEYARDMRHFNDVPYSQIPLETTVRGQILGGLLGPVFLLAPLTLLALRYPAGRQLLVAAVLFTLPYAANIGTRFLIPSLPFWALALGLAFRNSQSAAMALVLAHALSSWPASVKKYANPYCWHIEKIPFRPALRLVPEEKYLTENTRSYVLARMVEANVPPGKRVFAFGTVIGEAYTSREILVSFQAALNRRLRNILFTPLIKEYQASRVQEFHFPVREIQKLRVTQTAGPNTDVWNISEFRILGAGKELAREPSWRLRANPNPWDVQSAFDNSPVTRWSAAEPLRPGMFVEVDVAQPRMIDAVRLECSRDQYQVRLKLEILDASGRWVQIGGEPSDGEAKPLAGLRRAAIEEMKRANVDYLLVDETDYGAADFRNRTAEWGLQLIDDKGGVKLYRAE
jgi:hypothetical protein